VKHGHSNGLLFGIFYPYSSVKMISVLTSLSVVFTGYIMALTLLSLVPAFVNTTEGEFPVVIYM